jgi:ABC-2 type transport system permease protein
MAFQRGFYKQGYIGRGAQRVRVLTNNSDLALRLVGVIVFSLALLWLAQRIFARAQGSFAQEL